MPDRKSRTALVVHHSDFDSGSFPWSALAKTGGLMAKRYLVTRTEKERVPLLGLTKKGKISARKLTRAHILLQANAGVVGKAIAAALHIGIATVERLHQRFVDEGMDAALSEPPRPGGQRKLDGKQEAFLIALACRTPPERRQGWTMQLLADTLVAVQVVEAISDEMVPRTLKTTRSNRG
jgi:transposase